MIRVLHIVGGMHRGGMETLIMNLYRNVDRSQIQFDFIVHTTDKKDYDDEIYQLGGKVFRVTRKKKNIFRNLFEIYKIIKLNKYNIVHRHGDNSAIIFVDLLAACIAGCHNRISHSHNSSTSSVFIHKLFIPLNNSICNYRLACGKLAGEWMYKKKNFEIINNGIIINDFAFSNSLRIDKREELEIASDEIVLLHVGRFEVQKNHNFIVELFNNLYNINNKYTLILIGQGSLLNSMVEKAKNLHIFDKIHFLSGRSDVNRIMMASDIFIFPSLYEGVPVSIVEAQVTGIPIIMSSSISDEVIFTDKVIQLDVKDGYAKWIEAVQKIDLESDSRSFDFTVAKTYDAKNIGESLTEMYKDIGGKA